MGNGNFLNFNLRQTSRFVDALKSLSEYDFSQYIKISLSQRLTEASINLLIEKISHDPEFLETVIKEITNNTTEMFRDPDIWKALRYNIFPMFNKENLSVWHAGCSTGEEVYSMMILLYELGKLDNTRIFGSDINSDVLKKAQNGIYEYSNMDFLNNFNVVIGNNPERFFDIDKTQGGVKIKMHDFLIQKAQYTKNDLVKNINPFNETYDFIICRNVLPYFNNELRNRVLEFFLDNLHPGACLLVAESNPVTKSHVESSTQSMLSSYFNKKFGAYFKK